MGFWRRRWLGRLVITAVLALSAGLAVNLRAAPPAAPPPAADAPATKPARQPVPNAAAKARALKDVQGAYGAELTGARSREQKGAIATKLLTAGIDTNDDPAVRYVLLDRAKELATAVGDDETALAATDQLIAGYDLGGDADMLRLPVCTAISKSSNDPLVQKRIAARLIELAAARVTADDYTGAGKCIDAAVNAARTGKDKALFDKASAQVEPIRYLKSAYADVTRVRPALQKDPADPHANLVTGKYHCFIKNRWSVGLPYLAKGHDAKLKALAQKELAKPVVPADQLALADGWWEAADRERAVAQAVVRQRAAKWYRRARPKLSGLVVVKVEKRLSQADASAKSALLPTGEGITERIKLIHTNFSCKAPDRVRKYPIEVPEIASGAGTLEITVWNMGDNSGDGGMHCELRDATGTKVFRHFNRGNPTFRHDVNGDTTWTAVLEDHDTRGDGNGGAIEVWVTPK